ncbi:thioredoxin-dependent thiol peroxidase [Pedobacter sp. MR2016-24]|uniref:thioredoxin-dependent thiol peroxidase n=1 Tax=Pedobacter sp. MR2016-24 TaxID=2994466 RepID=UPI0022450383|nr:thioredoxin-dependent thiol peroxidase [Pedobacter sp. MR2016-24]MCX2482628.1 thioredoxin-dependent thiol peroxidase [Pedobacter sp. MR2016-24]
MSDLKEGQKAPEFTAADQDGNTVTLSQFSGKKVVLYFYPKDDTPGCTAEACDFRDNYQGLIAKGIIVLGVSTDDEKSHQKFVAKHSLPFTLLADTDKKIVEAYGVWGEKNMYGKKYMGTNRTTFIIDEAGNILHVIKKVDSKSPTAQVLGLLEN